jgi:hypothetical protein
MSKNQYNPWENKNTFIQNVGNTESVLDIISSEGIDLIPSMPDFKNINDIKDENNNDEIINSNSQTSILPLVTQNEYSSTESTINSLEKLYELNAIQYKKLEQLEYIYEKYKYQSILNPQKNYELMQKLGDLSNFFEEIKLNKDKFVYLLHNSGITDSHVIKIKHSKKIELIKTLKLCCNKNNPMIDMIELYENMHENTLNKIKEKIIEKENKLNELIQQLNELQNIK